jgi:hypothetical protein
MAGRARGWRFLLLALAGCPQFQNDDWVVVDDASPSGDAANAPDAAAGRDGGANGGDASVEDAPAADAPSSGDDAAAEGSPPGPDGGPGPESGPPDSTAPDGPAAVQMIYCGLTTPRGIALSNPNVCWVGDVNPRGLYCAPAAGGGTPAHIDVPGDAPFLMDAYDVLFDTTNVYWSNGGNNQVVTRPQSGGPPQQYFTGGGRVSFLAAGDGTSLWATDFPDPSDSTSSSGEVIVGPSPGGTSSNAIYTGESGAAGVGMYSGNVYWGTPDGIAFGSVAGNTTIYRIASPETPVAGLAVDSTGVVYFLGTQSLYRYVTGAQSPTLVYTETQPIGAGGDVAVDDQSVYFSEPDLGCIVRIAR